MLYDAIIIMPLLCGGQDKKNSNDLKKSMFFEKLIQCNEIAGHPSGACRMMRGSFLINILNLRSYEEEGWV